MAAMHHAARSLLILACLSVPVLADAGACRTELRPLLLDTDPQEADVERVRAICAAEADRGDADASYQLALFSLGLRGNWQPDVALPLIRAAAERGVPEAQYWLAWQLESGPLLPNDTGQALSWYEKAASGRHRLALQRLAEASERGELGLPVDARKALEYRAQIRRCEEEEKKKSTRNR